MNVPFVPSGLQIQVLVGATLFRFESCRAHHFGNQRVPTPKGFGTFCCKKPIRPFSGHFFRLARISEWDTDNGLVMISFINDLRKDGMALDEAVIQVAGCCPCR